MAIVYILYMTLRCTLIRCFVLAAVVLAPCLALAGASQESLEALAAKGQIQENAALKANTEITIRAPREKVWQLLTDIDQWPKWQATVSTAHIDGPLVPGTGFTWTNGGTTIQSRLALVRPTVQIAWTGTAYKAHAVHVWTLQTLPDGTTLVKTTESMDGFLLSIFFSSKDLARSHEVWLKALKEKAER